jgi:hypothetical protein
VPRLLFIPEPAGVINWYDPTGWVVAWSWLFGAAAAWLCTSVAQRLLGFWEGGGLGLELVADLPISALACAIIPAVLTWRWCRTAA